MNRRPSWRRPNREYGADQQVWVRLIGAFEVRRSGRVAATTAVGSRKARTVLALLGVQRGRVVPVDRIIEVAWGGDPPRRPEANAATLVSRLRISLGSGVVDGGRTGYWLGAAARVDLHEAAGLISAAEARLAGGEPASSLAAAEQGLRLLGRGPVLADDPEAEWADQARAWRAGLLRRAWRAGAEAALCAGRPERAQVLAESAVAADPLDEAACRVLMRTCAASGEPARALIAYQRLRSTLAAELGVDPAAATRNLHLAVLRHTAAPIDVTTDQLTRLGDRPACSGIPCRC